MRKGFPLVELSIVLVVIALIAGGLLVGRSVLQASAIQSYITKLREYEVAIKSFKVSYEFYPGDSADFAPAGNGNLKHDKVAGLYSNDQYTQSWAQLSAAGMKGNFQHIHLLNVTVRIIIFIWQMRAK